MKYKNGSIKQMPTSGLLLRLEQYHKELLCLRLKFLDNPNNQILAQRISYIEDAMYYIKQTILKRFEEEDICLNKIALLIIKSHGVQEEIYQELFVRRMLNSKEWIEYSLLKKVVDRLSVENLLKITKHQEKTTTTLIRERIKNENEIPKILKTVEKMELEDIWPMMRMDAIPVLSSLARETIEKRLFEIEEQLEEELTEKINMDEKEGENYGKNKRKRMVK
ncbi:MAG: hypothetical protein E7168_04655 [Firmicutes bacterium]|nr:hypothetical protein [Bacillota bacterium]